MTWFSGTEVAQMVASGSPSMGRKRGNTSAFAANDRRTYLLLEDDVQWGEHLM